MWYRCDWGVIGMPSVKCLVIKPDSFTASSRNIWPILLGKGIYLRRQMLMDGAASWGGDTGYQPNIVVTYL